MALRTRNKLVIFTGMALYYGNTYNNIYFVIQVTERSALPESSSLVLRPSITANVVEGLVKLVRRMTSGGRLDVWLITLCMQY